MLQECSRVLTCPVIDQRGVLDRNRMENGARWCEGPLRHPSAMAATDTIVTLGI